MNRNLKYHTDACGGTPAVARRLLARILPLIFMCLAFLPGLADAQQGAPVATIININGKVEFRENDKADWKTAKKYEQLFQGYQVRTATGNKAMLLYNLSKSRVLVNENTQIEIQAQTTATGSKPTKERTKLLSGEVFSRITPGTNYEVETPSSVASVRGTSFDSKYNLETDEATYIVLESTVQLMNQLGTIMLNQLQSSTVKLGEKPQDPTDLSKGDADKLTQWKDGVEPKWRLNFAPDQGTDHETGAEFDILLSVLDTKTGGLDNTASLAIKSFTASTDIIEFSVDKGKTWVALPELRVVNGIALFRARVKAEGSVEINASADDAEPATVTLNVTKAKDKKKIEIQFTSPDGKETKTLILELEEK